MPEFKTEKGFQKSMIHNVITRLPRQLFCSSGVGAMNIGFKVGAAVKQFGYIEGFPDNFVYEPQGGFHGLGLELKLENGTQSKAQKDWEEALTARGYAYLIARSFGEAWDIVHDWQAKAEAEHGPLMGSGQIRRASKARKPKGKGW